MDLPVTKFSLAVLSAALCIILQSQPTQSLAYPVFGTKRYHRSSSGRSSMLGQPPPAPPPAPPLYEDTAAAAPAADYYDPYASAYVVAKPDAYNYQPQPDDEPLEYWPSRESQYYGMPTYRGEYNPKPYYYSHGPSYSYYDERSEPVPNPLDDLHEEMQQEDAIERQRDDVTGDRVGEWYKMPAGAGRQDSRLTANFLKNLMAYNQQINQQEMYQPPETPYSYIPDYDTELELMRHRQNEPRTHQPPSNQKQSSFYDFGDNAIKDAVHVNEPMNQQTVIEPPRTQVDEDVEALKTLVSTKAPKISKSNRKASKKQKQRRKQQAKQERERKMREQQALEEQREQQRLAEQEQQARRDMLARQQEEERRLQQELERQQLRREQILMQQQLQGHQGKAAQYADYQQEPSSASDYFVEPEYDDSWSSWDRKRSQLPALTDAQLEELIAINRQKSQLPKKWLAKTTMAPPLDEVGKGISSAMVSGDGQKEIMLPRPSNPVRQPFTPPIMDMLTHNRLEHDQVESDKRSSTVENVPEHSTHAGSTVRDDTVYGTIKQLLDMDQRLEKQVQEKTVQKRYVNSDESLVRQLKNLKRSV